MKPGVLVPLLLNSANPALLRFAFRHDIDARDPQILHRSLGKIFLVLSDSGDCILAETFTNQMP